MYIVQVQVDYAIFFCGGEGGWIKVDFFRLDIMYINKSKREKIVSDSSVPSVTEGLLTS